MIAGTHRFAAPPHYRKPFAACMRDNGFDMPDPDFSGLALRGDGPFGEVDLEDPAFESALEQCDDILANIQLTGTDE